MQIKTTIKYIIAYPLAFQEIKSTDHSKLTLESTGLSYNALGYGKWYSYFENEMKWLLKMFNYTTVI